MKFINTKSLFALFLALTAMDLRALPEMVIGESSMDPGIILIFEGGIKDDIQPAKYYLEEKSTDVHLEVLANWSETAPSGSPLGGHVAYLEVTAEIINEQTKESSSVELTPHLNMSDNLHYAQNVRLPGKVNETYTVIFKISEPKSGNMGMHFDWRNQVAKTLTPGGRFEFNNLDFEEIALSTRR
ncbi:MAG: iron transporter [Gammaproteobacteria bacterium]|nr:iron transporter [Gammaproteobacteria bacterium]